MPVSTESIANVRRERNRTAFLRQKIREALDARVRISANEQFGCCRRMSEKIPELISSRPIFKRLSASALSLFCVCPSVEWIGWNCEHHRFARNTQPSNTPS